MYSAVSGEGVMNDFDIFFFLFVFLSFSSKQFILLEKLFFREMYN